MRKILCFIIAIMGFVNAQNNDDIKINVVKNFYNNSDLSENAKKFGTASFKTAISDGEAAGCLDFYPVVSGQEICDKPKYDFKAIGSDEVEVTQTCDYGGDNPLDIKTIVYALKCKQNECKVDDIFNFVKNDNGAKEKFSTKEYLFECIEEYVTAESEANNEEFTDNANNIQNNADSFAGNAKDKIQNFINNVENKVDEVKQMVNFEPPSVGIKEQYNNKGKLVASLVIQARDNNTIINEMVINRGNCPVILSRLSTSFGYTKEKGFDDEKMTKYFNQYPENEIMDFDLNEEDKTEKMIFRYFWIIKDALSPELQSEIPNKNLLRSQANGDSNTYVTGKIQNEVLANKLKEYAKNNPKCLIPVRSLTAPIVSYLTLNTKNGQKIWAKEKITNKNKEYWDSLDDDSKTLYNVYFPTKPLQFGEYVEYYFDPNHSYWFGLSNIVIGCSKENILEIVLKTNGGDFKYEFKNR